MMATLDAVTLHLWKPRRIIVESSKCDISELDKPRGHRFASLSSLPVCLSGSQVLLLFVLRYQRPLCAVRRCGSLSVRPLVPGTKTDIDSPSDESAMIYPVRAPTVRSLAGGRSTSGQSKLRHKAPKMHDSTSRMIGRRCLDYDNLCNFSRRVASSEKLYEVATYRLISLIMQGRDHSG
ncbi:hypothetical protein EJ03DRAFT_330110 [Teratosphaeria nubilosa]|uniref:Uncharacterized protein n=1 Tax=Teratosphaeria nubilosa TaxID=161662 RepID=A0A6G1L116_9PEZI|nr:hypothetical protein EJ03DRAFT_330110 [Teratosphaeria nubilosa]